jgi:hypothetical protein
MYHLDVSDLSGDDPLCICDVEDASQKSFLGRFNPTAEFARHLFSGHMRVSIFSS